jgi:lipoprotein-anchoring transpeptidase ErfK/SrfK
LVTAERAIQQDRLPEAQATLEELIGNFPDSSWVDEGLLKLGQVYEQQRQLLEARAMYRLLLERFPESPLAGQAQALLGSANIALLFSPILTELDEAYEVASGDTLGKIAQSHRTTIELLKRANGLTSDVIRPKQKLKVPKGRFSVVVDKSQNHLLLTEENQFVKSYPVATGQNNSTPVGTFRIVNKIANPVWYRQGAVVPPDSPENILGTRWLGLDKAGYGIHGSVEPSGIGQQITAGCVRMSNSDVEELFVIVPTGTEVTIVD